MDNNINHKSGGNFFSGFLLGALVGAGLVFLFGTEKGKKILKIISEKGLENVSNMLEKAEKKMDLDGIHEENEKEEIAPKREAAVKEAVEEKPKVRRFFRGISRHVN